VCDVTAIIVTQLAELSAADSASTTGTAAGTLKARPPWLCGASIRNTPTRRNASTISPGTRRRLSISSARGDTGREIADGGEQPRCLVRKRLPFGGSVKAVACRLDILCRHQCLQKTRHRDGAVPWAG
jgi:hypothetical protein